MKFKEYRLFLLPGLTAAALMVGFFLGSHTSKPVIVTGRTPPKVQTYSPTEVTEPRYPIDINTADADTLDFLPGIGPELAEAIVEYRAEHGSFSAPEDLMKVSGIGPAKLKELYPYITTGG